MKLREGEEILRVIHHHPTPFVFQILKAIAGIFPFFFVAFFFQGVLSQRNFVILNIVIFALFVLVVVYLGLIYWLDKLVITNYRIVHVDWKYLTIQDESEAHLNDIQDILTKENGILAHFRAFDYGTLSIDTSSARVTLTFIDAPDPEEIRKFIYHVRHVLHD